MSYSNNQILISGYITDIESNNDEENIVTIVSYVFNPKTEENEEENHQVLVSNLMSEYIKNNIDFEEMVSVKGSIHQQSEDKIIKAERIYKNTLNLVHLDGFVGVLENKKNNVTIINIATNDFFKNKEEEKYEKDTDWHKIVCFGKISDVVRASIENGDLISVSGRIKTKTFEEKKYTEIIAETVKLKRKNKKEK